MNLFINPSGIIQLPSGISIIPNNSGTNIIGTVAKPINIIYANNIIGTISGTFNIIGISPLTFSGNTVSIASGSSTQNGYISSVDWNTFNNKQVSGNYVRNSGTNGSIIISSTSIQLLSSSGTIIGNYIISGSNITPISSGTGVFGSQINPLSSIYSDSIYQGGIKVISTSTLPLIISSGNVSIFQASSSGNGYLSSVDWNTFNEKQPAGNYVVSGTDAVLNTLNISGSQYLVPALVIGPSGSTASTSQILVSNIGGNGTNGTLRLRSDGNLQLLASDGIQLQNSATTGNLNPSSHYGASIGISGTEYNNIYAQNIYQNDSKVVSSVTSPIIKTNENISISQAASGTNGYLASGDWITFNNSVRTNTPYLYVNGGFYTDNGYTDNGNATITVSGNLAGFYSNNKFSGSVISSTLTSYTTATLSSGVNYIVGSYNSGSPTYAVTTDVNAIDFATIIPYLTVYRYGTELSILPWDGYGAGPDAKTNERFIKTQRFAIEPTTPLTLSVSGTRITNIAGGYVWNGLNRMLLSSFTSASDKFIFYYHSGGNWVRSTTTTFNNSQYDDGTNLVSLNVNRYNVNWIYRQQNISGVAYCVLGNVNATAAATAVASTQPSLPPEIVGDGVPVGRIIGQQGTDTPYLVETFTSSISSSATTDHNALAGLQGGITGEYYHLTSVEYSGFITSGTSSGTGIALFNSKSGHNLVFNTISGNGLVNVTYNNGLINISGIGTVYSGSSPISVTNGLISIASGSATQNGYISSVDWTRFNNMASASGNYLQLTGGNLSGPLSGTSSIFNNILIPISGGSINQVFTTIPTGIISGNHNIQEGYLSIWGTKSGGAVANATIDLENRGTTTTNYPELALSRSRGVIPAVAAVASGDSLGHLGWWSSVDVSGNYVNNSFIHSVAAQNQTSSTAGSRIEIYNTELNSSTPTLKMTIGPSGIGDIGSSASTFNNIYSNNFYANSMKILPRYKVELSNISSVNNTIGLLYKSYSTGSKPTTDPSSQGLDNGGCDPILVDANVTVSRISLVAGGAAVGTSTISGTVYAQVDIYELRTSSRTLLGTVYIPISSSGVGINNNLGTPSKVYGTVSCNIQVSGGSAVGAQWTNISTSPSGINALKNLNLSISGIENSW